MFGGGAGAPVAAQEDRVGSARPDSFHDAATHPPDADVIGTPGSFLRER